MMRGSLTLIRPLLPSDLYYLINPPTIAEVSELLGGQPDIVPYWDHWFDWSGRLVPATVVGNSDWRDPIQPMNLVATSVWHYVAKAKGTTLAAHITGPVAVFIGDEDFMQQVLSD